jgi:hypothetical protein
MRDEAKPTWHLVAPVVPAVFIIHVDPRVSMIQDQAPGTGTIALFNTDVEESSPLQVRDRTGPGVDAAPRCTARKGGCCASSPLAAIFPLSDASGRDTSPSNTGHPTLLIGQRHEGGNALLPGDIQRNVSQGDLERYTLAYTSFPKKLRGVERYLNCGRHCVKCDAARHLPDDPESAGDRKLSRSLAGLPSCRAWY